MRSLYLKVFLAGCLTMMLVAGGNMLLTWGLGQQFANQQLRDQQLADYAQQALDHYLEQGPRGLQRWRHEMLNQQGLRILLLDDDYRNLSGGPLPPQLHNRFFRMRFDDDHYLENRRDHDDGDDDHHHYPGRRWQPLIWPFQHQGERYQFVVLNPRQLLDHLYSGKILLWRLGLSLLLIAALSILMARYLITPIRQLQQASRQLASGDLSARIAEQLKRQDELGQLGQDFDQMAERIQSLVDNQKQLLRDVSHELRTPLARQRVALELARKQFGDNQQLDRIEQQAEQLEQLIEEILTLSRLDGLQQTLEKEPIDINQLLQALVDDYQPEHPDRLVWSPGTDCQLSLNPKLVRRALGNIIGNALKYSEGVVKIEQQRQGNSCCIRISDLGPGVEPAMLEQIFEPFVRTDKARSRQQGGWGLGLAIAARAIHQHQGQISARNLQPQGLQIEIRLPL